MPDPYDMNVYWSDIEFRYRRGSRERTVLAGGMFFAFVRADDARDALRRFVQAVSSKGLDIHEVKMVAPYDESVWEERKDAEYYSKLAQTAESSGDVVFSDADVYEDDEQFQ